MFAPSSFHTPVNLPIRIGSDLLALMCTFALLHMLPYRQTKIYKIKDDKNKSVEHLSLKNFVLTTFVSLSPTQNSSEQS